jgi:hypothetical protein
MARQILTIAAVLVLGTAAAALIATLRNDSADAVPPGSIDLPRSTTTGTTTSTPARPRVPRSGVTVPQPVETAGSPASGPARGSGGDDDDDDDRAAAPSSRSGSGDDDDDAGDDGDDDDRDDGGGDGDDGGGRDDD